MSGSAVPLLLAAPLLLFMLAFYALPVVTMLMRSVSDPAWSLSHYAALPDDTVFQKVFWNTLYTSVIVTLGTLLLGYPVALALVRTRRWAPLILILILLPFWTSVLVRSYAWMVLMGRHGLINEALLAAGLDVVAVEPQPAVIKVLRLLYGRDRAVVGVLQAAAWRSRRATARRVDAMARDPDAVRRPGCLRRGSGERDGCNRQYERPVHLLPYVKLPRARPDRLAPGDVLVS